MTRRNAAIVHHVYGYDAAKRRAATERREDSRAKVTVKKDTGGWYLVKVKPSAEMMARAQGNPMRRKRKNAPRRKNAGSQSKLLKNFTGVVRLNKDKTVSIVGTGKKANPSRKRRAKRVNAKRRAKR